MTGSSSIRVFGDVFTAPAAAFDALRLKPTFLLPLLALIAANSVLILWYYHVVDPLWLIDTALERRGTEIPAGERERVLQRIAQTPPAVMGATAAAATAAFVTLMLLLMAAYLAVISLVTNDGFRFRQWFSLVCWCSLPGLLGTLAAMVNLAVSDATYLPAESLNPLTFASVLALDLEGASGGVSLLLQTMDLTSLWTLALLAIGYAHWTGRPRGRAAAIVLAPPLLVIAAVLLTALM